jgi:hypothetical protein
MENTDMQRKLKLATIISLILISLAFVMAYFVKPHPLSIERADVPEDIASLIMHSSDIPLSNRISKSRGLAMVFVISEFSQKNANALGAVREWATNKFDQDPTFIYATQTPRRLELPASIFSSFFYNLLAGPRILAEEQGLRAVKRTMKAFHKTEAYAQLKSDFYESFGKDKETSFLLAHYEFDRARDSVPVVLAAVFWLAVILLGVYRFIYVHKSVRDKLQNTLSGLWFVLAIFYLIETWTQNSTQVALSSLLCAGVGFYLRRPIVWSRDEDTGLSFKLIRLGSKPLALISFLTLSLMGIHILTWIKTGTIENPDPVTLIVSACTGNFFHDPTEIKRDLARSIGALWLLFFAWTARLLMMEFEPDLEAPENLDALPDGHAID